MIIYIPKYLQPALKTFNVSLDAADMSREVFIKEINKLSPIDVEVIRVNEKKLNYLMSRNKPIIGKGREFRKIDFDILMASFDILRYEDITIILSKDTTNDIDLTDLLALAILKKIFISYEEEGNIAAVPNDILAWYTTLSKHYVMD